MSADEAPPRTLGWRGIDGEWDAAHIVSPELVMTEAVAAAKALLESQTERWRIALSSATPAALRLVQRLDREDDYYFIVSFQTSTYDTARLLMDARTNRLGEAIGVDTAGAALRPFLDPAVVLREWYDRTLDLPRVRGRVIRRGTAGLHPVLVWRPCQQSTSPFLPFYLISVGDQFVYWRVDGKAFDRLTTGPA